MTQVVTLIGLASVCWHRLSLAETNANDGVSATCYRRAEDVRVISVVVTPLEFRDV